MANFSPLGFRGAPAFFSASQLERIFPADLQGQMSAQRLAEIRSLARERDREIFNEGLLALAGRMEQEGDIEGAGRVYAALANTETRARQRLDAITGVGAAGPRAEFLLRRLTREALDPAPLAGMFAAGAAFRLTRIAMLARSWRPVSANLVAFGAEAAVFPLGTRLMATALGRELTWEPSQVGQELASSFIVLGAMRLTGSALNSPSFVRRGLGAPPGLDVLPLPVPPLTKGRGLLTQAGMLGGILLGHRLETAVGLREHRDGATTLTDSLALLLQFNIAGRLMHQVAGPTWARWERELEMRGEALRINFPSPLWGEGQGEGLVPLPAFAGPRTPPSPRPSLSELLTRPLQMTAHEGEGNSSPSSTSLVRLPEMGLYREREPGIGSGTFQRLRAAERLRKLMPEGKVAEALLADPQYVAEFLSCFAVTSHPLDIASFRAGFEIGRHFPERVRDLAFDIDEVYHHWTLSLTDLFRGIFERGRDPLYQQTSAELLRYQPFRSAKDTRLNWFERLWFRGVQGLLKGRMRQTLQFHPGVRALQLGLRFGQGRDLVMATTGPAGRILILANEDPAMRMIYFGKGPEDFVTIQELRDASNIYTREHLVLAMREVLEGTHQYPDDPWVRDYVERVRRYPDRGVKLKHPAIATLLGKRRFSSLVDDSASTFKMLGEVPNFTVLQPPSARPPLTLNFVFFRKGRYLNRMRNGYVEALAETLANVDPLRSQVLGSGRPTPRDYPHQRFQIEIPWRCFEREYVLPAHELRDLAGRVGQLQLAAENERPSNVEPSQLGESTLRGMAERLRGELALWTEGTRARSAVEFGLAQPLQEMARRSPQSFEQVLKERLSEVERSRIPEMERPLAERSEGFFSQVAALFAAKRAALRLLNLREEDHARELEFRFGRPFVSGTVQEALAGKVLNLSLAQDGNAGIGVALLEPSPWESGMLRLGIDLTTFSPQHALARAAHKAVSQAYPLSQVPEFHAEAPREIRQESDGRFYLSGRMAAAARGLRGEKENPAPLELRAFHFRAGSTVLALVGIPANGSPDVPSVPRPPEGPPPSSGGGG